MEALQAKFDNQYNALMNMLGEGNMFGGAAASDSDSDMSMSDSDRPKNVKVRDGANIIKVGCVNVVQSREGFNFEGKMCKNPAITLRFREPNEKVSRLVKAVLNYMNKGLRMKSVKEVVFVKGKKKTKHNGEDLSAEVNLKDLGDLDEINIKMD